MEDQFWMREALEVARQGAAIGEVPVGAIIVKAGRVIARAHNQREQTKDPTAHAELIAIRAAASSIGDWRLIDTTLYVTLEPCPKAGAGGTLFNLLQDRRLNHWVDVVHDVLVEESRHLLKSFFRDRRA